MNRTARFLVPALMVMALQAQGCKDDNPLPAGEPVPDFSLQDVNPNSATHNQAVSPRAHLGHVSAWYFGHAT